MATSTPSTNRFAAKIVRALPPILILAAGAYGFSRLASSFEEEPPPAVEKRTLRTRVENLCVTDYPVIISTNAVVQAHNAVTLSAEVSGVIASVSPSFEVGSYFAKGDLLVQIDDRNYVAEVSLAKSRLDAAKSALKLTKLNEDRKLRLIESNAVSRAEVDSASANREQAEADVELAATQVEQAELNLRRTQVLAPFDGRVRAKQIGLGQMANANTPLGEIFAVDYAEVRLPISARQRKFLQLPEFADDEPVPVTLQDGINRGSGAIWQAKIVRTEGVLDADSRDVFAIARVDDPFGRESGNPPLRIGQPVTALIEGEVLRDVIALPRSAVRQLDQVVLVNEQDQTLLPITVTAVWSDAEHVVVDGNAIPKGMWLATTPMVYTPEGAQVDIIPEDSSASAIAESTTADQPQSVTN